MATDKERRDAAVAKFASELAHLRLTTRGLKNFTPPASSEWGKALKDRDDGLALLAQIGTVVEPPPPPPPPTGSGFYVSLAGSDSNDGSSGRPWKTIAKACASVSGPAVISVAAGTYTETAFRLPNGVSLVGAGIDKTIIRCTSLDKLFSVLDTTGPQTISDLTLDGQGKTTANYGLWTDKTVRLTITRIKSQGFKGPNNHSGGAVNIRNATDLVLSHSTLKDSSYVNPVAGTYVSGTLGIGGLTRAKIHDNVVSDQTGYAVKNAGDTGGFPFTDCEIFNNQFLVYGASGAGWNMLCFEVWNGVGVNNRIHHNHFNGVLSMSSLSGPLASGNRWRIDHNRMDIPSGGGAVYAIEAVESSMEIDHNFITGGNYPIATFTMNGRPQKNIAHHNVFDNQQGPVAVWHYVPGGLNCQFYKNTVVGRQGSWSHGWFLLNQGGFEGSTFDIRDNIFKSVPAIGDRFGAGLGSSVIDRNVFHNITGRGTNQINVDPQLPLSGAFPNAYMPANPAVAGAGAFADGVWSDVGPQ